MNPITFNKPIEDHLPDEIKNELLIQSPIVLWDSNVDRPNVGLDLVDDQYFPRLPFDSFRCSFSAIGGESSDETRTTYPVKGKLWFLITRDNTPHPAISMWIKFDKNSRFPFSDHVRCVGYHVLPEEDKIQWFGMVFDNGRYSEALTEESKQTFANFTSGIAYDYLNPHIHLAKVSPAPRGHSVLWQKQREHYVFIHKDHPANKKENKGKKLVVDGCTIDRMAHSRRAHFRLLKSPKFTKKQGQKVWVKSAWCGPTEWTDRSGQIYKIIEKPNSVGTAALPESAPRPPVS